MMLNNHYDLVKKEHNHYTYHILDTYALLSIQYIPIYIKDNSKTIIVS